MKKSGRSYGQEGSVVTIVAIIVLAAALIAVSAFAAWAYKSRQDYKTNSDQKVTAAVDAAKKAATAAQKRADDEQAKLPVLTFTGPSTYGAVTFNYPRTWDGYVDTTGTSNPIEGLFYNGIVPPGGVFYALRIELTSSDYSSVVNSFSSSVKKGTATASAYIPPLMVGKAGVQTGTRIDGQIEKDVQGSMVIEKVRDKTLKIFTESPTYLSDFNNTVLASLTYVP